MEEKVKSLVYKTKANDVDEEKGIVTVAVNGIGVEDSQGDISMPGSFNKTLKENMGRMRWFLNHDTTQLLGVPLRGEEIDGNLVMTGQINKNKQIGRDTLADYKLFAEAGRTLEHSIGVRAIKRDEDDKRKVKEWKMYEYSTLTSWGSNPQTFLVNIKSATQDQVKDAIDFLKKALNGRYSDERLKQYDMNLDILCKALEGANIVTCPYCGTQFDYDEQNEITFESQVLETAANYTRWITDDVVYDEIQSLKPEIQQRVIALIDAVKSSGKDFDIKSLEDFRTFVRCPHCWTKVYRSMLTLSKTLKDEPAPKVDEPSEDTQVKSDQEVGKEKEAANGTSFFNQLNDIF